jgi:hypothetical protein
MLRRTTAGGQPSDFTMAGPWLGIAALGENVVSVSNGPGGGVASGLPNDKQELFGWNVAMVDNAGTPVREDAKETWGGLRDASGSVAAYRVSPEDGFDEVWAVSPSETWTALEIAGTVADLYATAACAIRTNDKPVTIARATPLNARHRPVLDALSPLSMRRLADVTGT